MSKSKSVKNTKSSNTKSSKSSKSSKTDFLTELRTLQKRGKTELSSEEHYNAAYEAAYTFILKGYQEKMRQAAERGRTRCYLYRWNYEKDPKSRKFKFKGVRILDILTKGDLIEKLKTHFEKINPEFTVGWHKFKNDDSSQPTRYGIYVSWEEVTESSEENDSKSDDHQSDEEEEEEEVEVTV